MLNASYMRGLQPAPPTLCLAPQAQLYLTRLLTSCLTPSISRTTPPVLFPGQGIDSTERVQ